MMSFILFAVLIAISILYMLSFTNLTITDTDPSTYVIIPIIMLPIFGFFYIKKNIKIDIKRNDVIFGVSLFVISILLSLYLRIFLSFMFFTYRIDLIILPLILISLISLLFGIKNIKKFYFLFLYSIFASPLLLIVILKQNILFTIINTKIVYGILSVFFKGIVYSAPITIIANGYHIGIGESCVGLGLLIAIAFLLIPVAFFYDGKIKKKIFWIVFGVLLMLLLNIFRMSFIAFDWILNGPTSALSLFHEFAGIILFYISIIIVLLLQGKFGLSIPKIQNKKINKVNNFLIMGIIFAVILSVVYMISYFPYNPIYISPYASLSSNTSIGIKGLLNSINGSGYSEEILNYNNKSYAIGLVNSTLGINTTQPVVISYSNSSYNYKNVPNIITYEKGVTGNMYFVNSSNNSFVVFEEIIPYNITSNEYGVTNMYFVIPESSLNNSICNNNQLVQSLNNLLFLRFYNNTVTNSFGNAYCIINKVVNT